MKKTSLCFIVATVVLASIPVLSGGAQINFAGRTWLIRDWGQNEDPGPNYWSTNAVWVDAQSNLHIKIYQAGGTNYCGEVLTTNALGYGRYIWYVSNRVDLLDENVVAGLFTYAPPWGVNEIDIEFTRAFDINGTNTLVYSLQPYYAPNHQRQFAARLTNGPTTHSFYWIPGYVRWQSWHGWCDTPSNASDIIADFSYTGTDVPTTGAERVFMNLWLFEGQPPSTGLTEIVIRDFRFLPASPFLFSDEFSDSTRDAQWDVTGVDYPGGLVETNGTLIVTPYDDDYYLLGYRTASPLNLTFSNGLYEFTATLRGADIIRASTQAWAAGAAVHPVFCLVSGPVWYDPWSATNAITVRGTYDTNDTLFIELFTKTNNPNSWGDLRFWGRLNNISNYRDTTGLTFRLILDATNYQLVCRRGNTALAWQTPWGATNANHQMGSSLTTSYYVIAAANIADGRGSVLWERTEGRLGITPEPPPPDPIDIPASNEVQVLDTNITAVWRHPMDTSQNKARITSLYLASEIGRAGLVTALAVRTVSSPGITLQNYTIRLQHTTNTVVPAWTSAGWTTVYVANVTGVTTGWHYFALQTPFQYNGTNNLFVDFTINNTSRENNPLGYCRRVAKGGQRSRYAVSKTGTPLTWTSPTGTVTGDVVAIRFSFFATNPPVGPAQLLNPEFEDGPPGDDVMPMYWWTYASAAKFTWAGYEGVGNGVAFKNWWSNSYGGFGQDVQVNLDHGSVFLFSIYGSRDSNFVSSTSNVWLQLEAMSATATNAIVTRNIYNDLMSQPLYSWTLFSIGYTNTFTNTTSLRVSVHFANGQGELPGYRTVKWDKAFLVQTNADPRDNSAYGVPVSWMEQHGILPTNSTVADQEVLDHDADGMLTWQEYVAGTIPTNAASKFEIMAAAATNLSDVIRFSWSSLSGRIYRVDTATTMTGPFELLSNNIPATPPINTFTSAWSGASGRLYRVRVRLQ